MARKQMPDYKLISIWFTTTERTEYETWIAGHPTDLLDLLLEIQENGFKLSISSQDGGEVSLISITKKPGQKNKSGQVFMYRHGDLEKAIRIAHYHFVTVTNFGNDLPAEESSTDW